MYWLPTQVLELLDGLVRDLAEEGSPSSRAEVIAALVLSFDPETESLEDSITRYRVKFTPTIPRRPRSPESRPLSLKLPSPITLRIDGLVDLLRREGEKAYRHQILGALILDCEENAVAVQGLCQEFRKADAGKAAIPGLPLSRVLSLSRPGPGARPSLP